MDLVPQDNLNAEELRRLMTAVRSRMSTEAAHIQGEARQLADWKFYVQRFTGSTLTACAVLGYLAVPRRLQIISPNSETLEKLARSNRLVVEANPKGHEQPGLVDSIVSLAGNVLLKAGLAYAGQQMGKIFGEQMLARQSGEVQHDPGS